MNLTSARALLERYLAGSTSLEEEQRLAKFLKTKTDLPADLQPYRSLFAYFGEQRQLTAPVPRPRRRRLYTSITAAAAVALLLLAGWNKQAPEVTSFPVAEVTPVDWSKYEVTDKEEALRILTRSLSRTGRALHTATHLTLREVAQVGHQSPIQAKQN